MINNSETSWNLLTVGHNSPSPDACLHRITSSILEVLLNSACRNGSKSRYCTQRKSILRGNVWTYGHEQNCSFNLVPGCEWIHTYGTVTVAPLWNTSVPTNFLSATGSTPTCHAAAAEMLDWTDLAILWVTFLPCDFELKWKPDSFYHFLFFSQL